MTSKVKNRLVSFNNLKQTWITKDSSYLSHRILTSTLPREEIFLLRFSQFLCKEKTKKRRLTYRLSNLVVRKYFFLTFHSRKKLVYGNLIF